MSQPVRLGVVIPSVNVVLEDDFHRMRPAGVTTHVARMFFDRTLSPVETLEAQVASAHEAVRHLQTADVRAIAFACTSGSFFKGVDWDRDLSASLGAIADCPVVTTATACGRALGHLGVGSVAIVSPYSDDINQRFVPFLEHFGVTTVAMRRLDSTYPESVTPDMITGAVRDIRSRRYDALLLACTGMAAIDLIDPLEQETGRRVVTSNQATLWALLSAVGVRPRYRRFGTLMRSLTRAR
jgi:maleate cis-trans isomerase